MSRWFVHRDGGIGYSDEWEPYDSWKGEREIFPGVILHIDVYGKRKYGKNSRLLARRWCGRLRIHGWDYQLKTTHKSCKSVADATRHADKALTPEFLRESLTHFYSAKDRVICISRIEDGVAVPYLSHLGNYVDWLKMPYGEYVEACRDSWREPERIRTSYIKRSSWGYGGDSRVNIEVPTWAWS